MINDLIGWVIIIVAGAILGKRVLDYFKVKESEPKTLSDQALDLLWKDLDFRIKELEKEVLK